MIVWGHGLERYQDIIAMVHTTTPSVRLWYQKITSVKDIGKFVQNLYQEDVARVGGGHISAKTAYLKTKGNKLGVVVLFDPNCVVTTYGDGKWKISANKRMVDLKWTIRRAFNPNPDGKTVRDQFGVFSHHHVVHVSDTTEGVDLTLKGLGLPTTTTLQRTHHAFFTPWFIGPPSKYKVETVPVASLQIGCAATVGKCQQGKSVSVSESLQYAFAVGKEDLYAAYYSDGLFGGRLTDDHTVESFRRLRNSFVPEQYPPCQCGYDGVERRAMIVVGANNRILDGAHRAALLLANHSDARVPVVLVGVEGKRVDTCQRTIPSNHSSWPKMPRFRAQKGQDRWIHQTLEKWSSESPNGSHWKALKHFYVDLAANEPHKLSSTSFFDELGWNGVCIDGSSKYTDAINKSKRTCVNVKAIVDSCPGQVVQWTDRGVIGGIVSKKTDNNNMALPLTIKATTTTLEKILDSHHAPAVIDFLSLDVKGSEFRIMENFPFDKYRFLTIAIERPPPWLNDLLFRNEYVWMGLSDDGFGSYYVHQTLGNIIKPTAKFYQVEQKCKGVPGSKCKWPQTVPPKSVCSEAKANDAPAQIIMTWIQHIQHATDLVVFKYDDSFPDTIKPGGDVDVLVASATAAVAAVRLAPFGDDVHVQTLHDGTQVHVDYVTNGQIVVRLDLYEAFQFPDVSDRVAPTPEDVFADAVEVHTDQGWSWAHTSLPHECRLRWMEWAQWHKSRPDKKAHLDWIARHDCNNSKVAAGADRAAAGQQHPAGRRGPRGRGVLHRREAGARFRGRLRRENGHLRGPGA